jgi:hypothetical protein
MFPQGRKEDRLDDLSPSGYHDHEFGKSTVSVSGADMAAISYWTTIFDHGSILQASVLHLNSNSRAILPLNPEPVTPEVASSSPSLPA